MLKPEGRRLLPCEQANLNYSLLTSCVCPSCHYNSIAESGAACLTVLFYVLHLKGETFQEEPMTENYMFNNYTSGVAVAVDVEQVIHSSSPWSSVCDG